MRTGPIDTVIFVHGYSVRDLNSFNKLPALLQADGIAATSIYLAGSCRSTIISAATT
jgi:hypothetical protein